MTRAFYKSAGFFAAVGVLALAAVGFGATIRALKVTLKKLPIYPEPEVLPDGTTRERLTTSIPKETESWEFLGEAPRLDAEVEQTLGTKNYVSRVYRQKRPGSGARGTSDEGGTGSQKQNIVDVHLAYYTGMIDTVPHVPDRCFVGGGMLIGAMHGDLALPLDKSRWSLDLAVPAELEGKVQRVRLASGQYARLPRDPEKIRMRTMSFLSQGETTYAGYFFIANGGTTPSAEDVRLLAFDLTAKHAYYMKVQFTSRTVGSAEELAAMAASLLDEMFGEVMLCVPDWVKVHSGEWPRGEERRP